MANATIFDRTRLALHLHEHESPPDSAIERRLIDVLGRAPLPVPRWFEIWKHLRWLLPQWDRLCFQMQRQQQSNWCWAAVAASVAFYYDAASAWTQCAVANAELGRSDCCGAGASTACNVPNFLHTALITVGHFDRIDLQVATFQSVATEIDAARPVAIRVEWSGGGAHFLAIIGCLDEVVKYVAVDDPVWGKSYLTYETLKTSYQGTGSWTYTYYTHA